jgi:hypothetical protein
MEDMPGGRGSEATPSAGSFDINDSTVGHKEKNAPAFRFGTEMQRTNNVYISKFHSEVESVSGKSFPGPGAHEPASAIGAQQLSQRRNGPNYTFRRGAETDRNLQIRPEPARTPGTVSKRKMLARRSTDILKQTIRDRRQYEAPVPLLPSPEDDEMQTATDSVLVRRQAPQFSIPRNPRVPAFFKHDKQPKSEYQTALMKCTQSPGPKYYPDPSMLDSEKERAAAFSFGVSGTCGRHSYLPHDTQDRVAGGMTQMTEHAHKEKAALEGTEALKAVISSIGKQIASRDKNVSAFSFGNSKRLHFSDQKVFTAESQIKNRKVASVYAAKWA